MPRKGEHLSPEQIRKLQDRAGSRIVFNLGPCPGYSGRPIEGKDLDTDSLVLLIRAIYGKSLVVTRRGRP